MLTGLIVVIILQLNKKNRDLVIVKRYYVSVKHSQILNNQMGGKI